MSSRYFGKHIQQGAKGSVLKHQQDLINNHYKFLDCKIVKNVLVCTGCIKPIDCKKSYKIELRYVAGCEPSTKILEPWDITPSIKIHMYQDHSLCLHYPPDMKWTAWTPIYKYTVPWIVEWIHFYEIYLINGGYWEGEESPVHFTENDKNRMEDFEDSLF